MTAEQASAPLVPVEEKTVPFYEDEVLAVIVETEGDRQVYVPLRPIVDTLGLDWSSQTRRLRRDTVLAESVRSVAITATEAGGKREMLCLPLDMLPGWLFGVTASRVGSGMPDELRSDLQEKIDRYRRECFRVLWEAFQREALGGRETGSALAHIRNLALAIAQQAEQQMILEGRVDSLDARMNRAARVVGVIDGRLAKTEENVTDLGGRVDNLSDLVNQLSDTVRSLPPPSERITAQQKATIQGLVEDLVASADSKGLKLWQGRNNYQAAYRTLNRTFGVSSYEEITQTQYPKAVEWLQREIDRLEGAGGS